MKKVILLSLIAVAIIFTLGSCNKPDCKHDDPTKIVVCEEKNATCQETGLTQGMKCTLCDTMVVPQAVIPKIDCIESDWIVDKEASQIGDGIKHTECTMCHRKIQEELIPLVTSEGLEYTLNGDGESYSVTGIGTCADTDVIIPAVYNGLPVTSIGNSAFYSCHPLTSVVIPDSVTSIGSRAFSLCDRLTSVVIPDSVASICEKAFYSCDRLTSVVIPDSVTSIGKSAFAYCTSLTSVVIGDNVTSIGLSAFDSCGSLISIEVDNYNEQYKSIDGNLYTKDGKTLIQYAIGKQDTRFVIPDSVASICEKAFYSCDSLTSVVIPDSVTFIGEFSFYGCSSLNDVYYVASEEKWNAITIGSGNYPLYNVTIHYNYVPEN